MRFKRSWGYQWPLRCPSPSAQNSQQRGKYIYPRLKHNCIALNEKFFFNSRIILLIISCCILCLSMVVTSVVVVWRNKAVIQVTTFSFLIYILIGCLIMQFEVSFFFNKNICNSFFSFIQSKITIITNFLSYSKIYKIKKFMNSYIQMLLSCLAKIRICG